MTTNDILHVRVLNGEGEQVADIDASSAADGMAYFLRSRNIDPTATPESVCPEGDHENTISILRVERHPISGVVESEYLAEVY